MDGAPIRPEKSLFIFDDDSFLVAVGEVLRFWRYGGIVVVGMLLLLFAVLSCSRPVSVAVEPFADSHCFSMAERGMAAFAAAPAAEEAAWFGEDFGEGTVVERLRLLACIAAWAATIWAVVGGCGGGC